jgi:lipoate-protein ligase A
MTAVLNVCIVKDLAVWQQLQIEEALLRVGKGNWCLINQGTPDAIVMGISGKREELINEQEYKKRPVPIIRRFSGGGTVYVEKETLFITFLFEKESLDLGTSPASVMEWTEKLYAPLFTQELHFGLRENDYVIGDKKVGGNAQYFSKKKWLHHTSFLWDYCPEKMNLLLMPSKAPEYRSKRSHEEFLSKLGAFFPEKEVFIQGFLKELQKQFCVSLRDLQEASQPILVPHRKSLEFIAPYDILTS